MIVTLAWNVLWQGALIYAATLLALRLVARENATTRYAVWFAALLALVLVPVLTITVHVGSILAAVAASARSPHAGFALVPLRPLESGAVRWLAWPAAFGSAWFSASVIALWAAGASFRLVGLGVSLARIAQIRRNAAEVDRIDGVPVLYSTELSIPIATGIAAPAILLPRDLAQTLTAKDRRYTVEHELAHLRRGDVAGNGVQRILEAIFFWNPWMRAVGRHLAGEREAACDDWAVNRLGEPSAYAFCLAELARRIVESSAPLLTPSAIGSRNALVTRIQRLTSQRSQTQARLNYFAVGGIAVLFAVMALAFQTILPVPANATATGAEERPFVVAQAACKNPNAPPQALDPAAPDLPKSQMPAHNVSAVVAVKVGADGKPHGVTIYKSSGNANVDRAVITAAEKSTYTPRLVNCAPHSGVYLFKADFAPSP